MSGEQIIALVKEFQCFRMMYGEKQYSFLGGLNLSKANFLSQNCFISTYFARLYQKNDFRLDTVLDYLFGSFKGGSASCENCLLKVYQHSIYFYLNGKVP